MARYLLRRLLSRTTKVCDPVRFIHVGPVEPTAAPSVLRCATCKMVFGSDDV